jgi:hypothetical protein
VVEVRGAAGRAQRRLVREAGRTLEVALPAYPGPDGRLEIGVQMSGGERETRGIALLPQPARFAAGAVRPDSPAAEGVRVAVRDLPRTAAGYRPIASLTLPAGALAGLDALQTEALAGYLAACGTLVLPDASPGLLGGVKASAGCGGETVTTDGETAGRIDPLPGADELASALPAANGAGEIALLYLPYLVLLGGLALAVRRIGAWVIALPPVAVLAYAAALPRAVVPATAVTWAEARADDGHQRFVTLVRLHGAGSETPPVRLADAAGLAMPARTAGTAGIVRLGQRGEQELTRPVGLLSYVDYRAEGAGPLPFRLDALRGADGELCIRNAGTAASPPGWSVSGGMAAELPPLAPGQSRGPGRDAATGAAPPIGRLAGARGGILLPVPAPAVAAPDARLRAAGWLLFRLPEDPR